MRLASGRSSAIRSVARLDRRTLAPATVPPIARYATLVGPTSLIPGQKHPLPPPPPPSPFPDPAPSHLPLDAPFAKTKAKAQDGKALPTKDAPPSVVRPSSLSPLDIYLLSWMRLLRPGAQPTLSELLDQMRERDHRQLDLTLDYEPTPSEDRRISPEDGTLAADGRLRKPIWMAEQEKLVRMASAVGTGQPIAGPSRSGWAPSTIDDGVVLLAHIFPSPEGQGPPRLVTCHGVALKTSDGSRLVATCAHPLSHLSSRLSAVPAVPSPIIPITSATGLAHAESASILFTPSGSVHPVTGVATCLGSADILVLEVGDRISASPTKEATAWRTAPVNPYPAPLGTRVWAHRFSGAGEAESKGRWDAAEIMEYKDDMGLAAKPGTYDSLSSFTFTAPPSPGASGGPIIDPSGSVVGLIRGSRADYGDRDTRGFAVVSEKFWEVFRLPGFKLASEKRREEQARRQAEAEAAAVAPGKE